MAQMMDGMEQSKQAGNLSLKPGDITCTLVSFTNPSDALAEHDQDYSAHSHTEHI